MVLNFLADTADQTGKVLTSAYDTFIGIVNVVLPILMALLLVLGMFYGIQLGVKYAKAEEDDDRKKAKQSLINVIVGFLIAIVFIAVIEIVLNAGFVKELFTDISKYSDATGTSAAA